MKIFVVIIVLIVTTVLISCNNVIKNSEVDIQDEIVNLSNDTLVSENSIESTILIDTIFTKNSNTVSSVKTIKDLIGFWVGDFRANDESKNIYADEGLYWTRENKINLSIDEITDNTVKGHSIVAGNSTVFEGEVLESDIEFKFEVSEIGNHKYDGRFSFLINKNNSVLTGTWLAFNQIEIPKRSYELQKKVFKYDSNQTLEEVKKYADWNKVKRTKITDEEERELFGDYSEQFVTATDIIYLINASSKLLSKKDVENLKKGDLLIIRNTIYARHGYSFKNRALRVFFDAQSWYVPVSVDIKEELTDLEKKNIQLLLKYEKNAQEYYNSFVRG